MAWERITWQDYGYHVANASYSIEEIIEATTEGRKAKYRPGMQIESVELATIVYGRLIKETKTVRAYFMIEPDPVGWDDGIETNIVRAEWGASPPGPVHGRPINKDNLLYELRNNRDEKRLFKQFLGANMNFVDFYRIIPRQWGADVLFCYLATPPHTETIDSNPVGIRMPGNLLIDVEWKSRSRRYVVSLAAYGELKAISQRECFDVPGIIRTVLDFGEKAREIYLGLHGNDNTSLSSSVTYHGQSDERFSDASTGFRIKSKDLLPDGNDTLELTACA